MHQETETKPLSKFHYIRILGATCAVATLNKAAYLMLSIIGEEYQQKPTIKTPTETYPRSIFTRTVHVYTIPEDVTSRNVYCIVRGATSLISHIFVGSLVDRRGGSRVLISGASLMLLSSTIFALEKSFIWLLSASIFEGLGSALVEVSCLVSIADVYGEGSKRRAAFGFLIAAQGFGNFILAPLLTMLHDNSGKISVYIIFSSLYLILLLILPKDKKVKLKSKCENCDKTFSVSVSFRTLIKDCYILIRVGLLLVITELLIYFFFRGSKPVWTVDYFYENDWKSTLMWITSYIPFILGIIIIVPLLKFSEYEIGMVLSPVILAMICCFMKWSFHIKHITLIHIIVFCAAIVNVGVLSSLDSYSKVKFASLEHGNLFALINLMYCFPHFILHLFRRNFFEMLCWLSLELFELLKRFLYGVILLPMKGLAVSV